MAEHTGDELATDHRFLSGTMWSLAAVFGAVIGGFFGAVVVFAVVGRLADETVGVAITAGMQLVTSAGILYVLSRGWRTGNFPRSVGLVVKLHDWWAFFAGFALQIAIVLAVVTPTIALLGIEQPEQQQIAQIIESAASKSGLIGLLFVTIVLAPVVEEVLYRGVLLRAILRLGLRDRAAIVISAAVFASIHLVDPQAAIVVPGLFVLGLVLARVTLKTGDLSRAILLHTGVNSLAAIALILS